MPPKRFLLLALLLVPVAAAQVLDARVAQIGFPATTTAGRVVRMGQWTPILTEMRLPGAGVFSGALRVVAGDLDADLVEFQRSPVLVNPEAGVRRYWAYAVLQRDRTREGELTVDLLNGEGAVVERLPAPPFDYIGNDELLVLDISARQVAPLKLLQAQGWTPLSREHATPYYRDVVTSLMRAEDLPDRWFGLEAVNVIVWDLPAIGQLGDQQMEALIEWVRRGGRLIVGVGANWSAIAELPLAEILPVTGAVDPLQADDLRVFRERFLKRSEERPNEVPPLSQPVLLARLSPVRGAQVTLRDQIRNTGETVNLISSHFVGSGRVTAVAGSLRELTSNNVNLAFFQELIDLSPRAEKYNENLKNQLLGGLFALNAPKPYDWITGGVSFSGSRTVFVLAAFGFVLIYGLAATFGTWAWLQRLKRITLSWTAFAVCAVAASGLGLLTVSVTRGLRQGLDVVSVVNLAAGEREATAVSWFGYGSAVRQTPEFSIGSEADEEAGVPRPLAIGPTPITAYATPARYAADPLSGVLRDVPVRGTLKQLEGSWRGTADGAVTGQLVADRMTGRLTSASWIRNDLPTALRGGYILYLDPRNRALPLDQLERAAGANSHWLIPGEVPASYNVLSSALPRLDPAERTPESWFDAEYEATARRYADWRASSAAVKNRDRRVDLVSLWELQNYWSGRRSDRPPGSPIWSRVEVGLLLASTFRLDLAVASVTDFDNAGAAADLSGLPDLDITHWLVRGYAVILAPSGEPGPVTLARDGRELQPRRGVTLYRVRMPITFTGSPPSPPNLEGEGQG